MSNSAFIIGPSFKGGMPDEEEITDFGRWLKDDETARFFDLWVSKTAGSIPLKNDMDPLLFVKILPQIYVEEYHPDTGRVEIRLMGEFVKGYTPINTDGTFYDEWQDYLTVEMWRKTDFFLHTENRPILLFYSLQGVDKGQRFIGDVCLPLRGPKGEHYAIGVSWPIGSKVFDAILREDAVEKISHR